MKAYLVQHLLGGSADRSPAREAARCSGRALTYQDLDERSDRLARLLIEQGVRPGDRVGIYREKGLESLVAVYGAMKARAAYVPIDPLVPASRLAFIVRDCGIRHLVTGPARLRQARALAVEEGAPECLIGIEPDAVLAARCIPWEEVWRTPAGPLGAPGTELDLAYVLYTSGSTGGPKGVMHSHRSALAFVDWAVAEVGVGASDRLSNHAPFHFDLSVFDLFAAAAAGATVVVVPDDVARFPASVASLIEEEAITVWYSVPFALVQMMQKGGLAGRDLGALRAVLFAGEPFVPKHLRRLTELLPGVAFWNLYGPTETNVCTSYRLPAGVLRSEEPIPIGRACANTELLIVDPAGEEVPAGEPGELLVRGASTMAGYWRRPELTEAAFRSTATDPPREVAFYRTGDLVRLGADGELHFLGRADRQVKVRGFRIELDEIESALVLHAEVEEAAVFLVADEDGSARIEAAVVPSAGSAVAPAHLEAHLSKLLPPHALPARIAVADRFPRTSTGKIDRRRLVTQAVAAARVNA